MAASVRSLDGQPVMKGALWLTMSATLIPEFMMPSRKTETWPRPRGGLGRHPVCSSDLRSSLALSCALSKHHAVAFRRLWANVLGLSDRDMLKMSKITRSEKPFARRWQIRDEYRPVQTAKMALGIMMRPLSCFRISAPTLTPPERVGSIAQGRSRASHHLAWTPFEENL